MINDLVKRLSAEKHEITIGNRDETFDEIKERLSNLKYIHVTFPNTKGGTELGINVDTERSDLTKADFNTGKGAIHIEGTTSLNFCQVKCIADVDLENRKGKGRLVLINN